MYQADGPRLFKTSPGRDGLVPDVTRYIETFFRHKLLLCMPIVLTLLVSIGYVATQPSKYTSGMTVWFATQLPGPSSIDNNNFSALAPAAQAQTLLGQLLQTRDFLLKAGN